MIFLFNPFCFKTLTTLCTSNGLNWERCSRCKYTRVLNKIPAKGHAFGVTHYGASCTAPEMTIKTCERCGKKEKQRRVNQLVTNGENGSWFQ